MGYERFGDKYDIVLGGGFLSARSPGYLRSGALTYGDVQAVLPFENEIVLCSVKGRELSSKFINSSNSNYFVYLGEYGNSVKNNIDYNAIISVNKNILEEAKKCDEEYIKIDSQIIDKIKSEGFLLLGRIYCFEDTIAPQRLNAYVYEDVEKTRIWFDDSAIMNGKVWLDPTKSKATDYLSSVIKEVVSMGADCIYLDSVQFPESRPGAVPVYTSDDTTLNRNLVLMKFIEKAVNSTSGRPVILGCPLECADGGNTEKWGGTLFDTAANICSPVLAAPQNGNYISYIENSYLVLNNKALNNFSTVKIIPTIKNPVENSEFYENLASSEAQSYIIVP